jgi:hypothetical protein
MRFSYIVLAFGILLLALAGYDELRGKTHAPSGGGGRYAILSPSHEIITKASKPEEFHNAMVYCWSRSLLFLLAGVIVYTIEKGLEKSDPMSSDSDENIDEELRKDELAGEVKKEEEQRKHPEL